MTIYDVLCYSKDSCSLSGKFCSINMLKGIVKANPPGVNCFDKTADSFNGKVAALEKACGSFGEKTDLKGDVAVKLYPFSFLPVILQFWEGDEEFPANLKFMFDENILQYIHYETIFYLLEHVTGRIQETMVMGKNEFGGRKVSLTDKSLRYCYYEESMAKFSIAALSGACLIDDHFFLRDYVDCC